MCCATCKMFRKTLHVTNKASTSSLSRTLAMACWPKQTCHHGTRYCMPFDTTQRRTMMSSQPKNDPNSNTTVLISVLSGSLGILLVARYLRENTESKDEQRTSLKTFKDPRCRGSSGSLIKFGTFWLPQEFIKNAKRLEEIRRFRIRGDDVIVASFPKSGTTWIQEIVYLILTGMENSTSDQSTIEERFPYIEYVYPGLKSLESREGSRLLKTHLPYEQLPRDICNGKGKLVYIARNPKDVAVSYYHFVKMLSFTKYSGEFVDFYKSFLEGKVPYGPWNEHVLEFWVNRDAENVLFITYEDLHKKPLESVRRIAQFLGKDLTQEQANQIVCRTCFSTMRDNPKVNYSWWRDLGIVNGKNGRFMRKGIIGDWKNYFSADMTEELDECLVSSLKQRGLVLVEDDDDDE